MPQDKSPSEKGRRQPLKDITPILKDWEYETGTINVRKIIGLDGEPKVQMRLDLGLLQMEMNGRPDGSRPHGCESLLDYHERRLRAHRRRNGSETGFQLSEEHCQSLREEALMYYHRYLSLFVLGEFGGVVRDTARNLRLLDLCGKYADREQDRLVLEQYRPYILMMNTRALASIELERQNYRRAWSIVRSGLREIKAFFARFGQESAYKQANEVRILRRFGREIRRHLPVDPVKKLQRDLERAVRDERYEEAARLRDELEKLRPETHQE
jgi:hypothetical protein